MALGLACATDSASERSASARAARADEPAFELGSDTPWPPEYSSDALWTRAAAGDDIDLARLARREGTAGLLQVIERGGRLGRVALQALEFATDRRAGRGALCSLLARADAPSRSLLLVALLEVELDALPVEGSLDPAADARCPSLLESLLERELPSPADRDRAAALLARLRPS